MTINEAVAVLNERRHNEHAKWYVNDEFVQGPDQYESFSDFEAIAIAEKYRRESTPSILAIGVLNVSGDFMM